MIELPHSRGYIVTMIFPFSKSWCEHHLEPDTEEQNAIILWNYGIYTNRQININKTDIVIKDLKQETNLLIDMITY